MESTGSQAATGESYEELRERLAEAEEALRAIRHGEVDALVVDVEGGHQLFTLEGADRFYRVLVEDMPEGAAVLDAAGTIVYANRRLAELLAAPLGEVMGASFDEFVPADLRAAWDLAARGDAGAVAGVTHLLTAGGGRIPVAISTRPSGDESAGRTVVVTDLSQAERAERERALEQQRAHRAQLLLRLTESALGAMPLDEMLTEMLRRLCESLPADSAVLLLAEPGEPGLVPRASYGAGGDHPADGASATVGLAERVMRERRAMVLGEVQLAGGPRARGTVGLAPLLAGSTAVGVLEVGRAREQITPEDLALVQLAAARTALAIDHARVVGRERRIAQTLQSSLLPAKLPAIPGVEVEARFRPAGDGHEIGGDFYDVFALDAGRWLFVLGDVCGKGPQAAALTALVRYTLRAEALHGVRPRELLRLLNQAILVQRSDLRFSTVVLLMLDLRTSPPTLTIASGGHPPPLIVRAGGTVELPSQAAGPLVGGFPDVEFVEHDYALAPGDVVVAYTDGMLEGRAPARILDPLGLADAARELPPRPLREFVSGLEEAALGPGSAPLRDDLALLALAVS